MTAPNHYENFPVGSILLPRHLRRPIHAVYAFARTADDIADEGNATPAERQAQLAALTAELDRIAASQAPHTPLMQRLHREAIAPFALPLKPFYDLLSAFQQDTEKTRYQNFAELIDYARRSANPIGRIILQLSLAQSDGICTALQLINFWQDIALDWQKNRIYLPQDDLMKFQVREQDIAQGKITPQLRQLIAHQCSKTHKILHAGAPLGKALTGRIGFEIRMIILGGNRILEKIAANQYDVFQHRPTLDWKDWLHIVKRAWQKK